MNSVVTVLLPIIFNPVTIMVAIIIIIYLYFKDKIKKFIDGIMNPLGNIPGGEDAAAAAAAAATEVAKVAVAATAAAAEVTNVALPVFKDLTGLIKPVAGIAVNLAGTGVKIAGTVVKVVDVVASGVDKVVAGAADGLKKMMESTEPVCPSGYTFRDHLCRQNCKPGETLALDGRCITAVPAGWRGTSTPQTLLPRRTYSTVGGSGADRVCAPGTEEHVGLCYTVPPAKQDPIDYQFRNYVYSSPGFYRLPCPNGMRWDGTACWTDAAVHTRPSYSTVIHPGRCAAWHGVCEKTSALMESPVCNPGFVSTGDYTCGRPAQAWYDRIKSVIGVLKPDCPPGKTRYGALCYPNCPAGTSRHGDDLEYCVEDCPPGTRMGIGGCTRPSYAPANVGAICPPEHPAYDPVIRRCV
jgi:hypothetical protein